MGNKKTRIEAIDGRFVLRKSGYDFVAWAATEDGKSRVAAFVNYSNMRAARGTVDLAAEAEKARISAELQIKRSRLQADKAENILRGVEKAEAIRVYDEAYTEAKKAAEAKKAEVAEAVQTAKAEVGAARAWAVHTSELAKMITKGGHSAETLGKVAGAYYKTWGIDLSSETLDTIGAYLETIDVKRTSDKAYVSEGQTLGNQTAGYLAKMIVWILIDTLEAMQVVKPSKAFTATYFEATSEEKAHFVIDAMDC